MIVGVTPAALLFVALGLALAFAPRRARALGLLALFGTLAMVTFVPTPRTWIEGVFLACWLAVRSHADGAVLNQRLTSTKQPV